MSKLNEMVATFPQTEFWNDSCSCKELAYAIENGGSGATTNPVIVGNVLKKELPDWEDTIKQVIADNPTWTEDDVAWDIIGKLGTKASKLLLPMCQVLLQQRPHGRAGLQTRSSGSQQPDQGSYQQSRCRGFRRADLSRNLHQRYCFLHLRTGSCSR